MLSCSRIYHCSIALIKHPPVNPSELFFFFTMQRRLKCLSFFHSHLLSFLKSCPEENEFIQPFEAYSCCVIPNSVTLQCAQQEGHGCWGEKYLNSNAGFITYFVTMSKFLSLFNVHFVIFKMKSNKSQTAELWQEFCGKFFYFMYLPYHLLCLELVGPLQWKLLFCFVLFFPSSFCLLLLFINMLLIKHSLGRR